MFLIKENDTTKMIFNFEENKQTKVKILMKESNIEVELNIKTIKLRIIENLIYVNYLIEDSLIEYELKLDIGDKE